MIFKNKDIFKSVYIIMSFAFIDIWLRVLTRFLGMYSIYELEPNLFTLIWSLFLGVSVIVFPKKGSKLFYSLLYFGFSFFAIIQYGYYLIFDKFLYLSDFMLVNEGIQFIDYVLSILNFELIIQVLILIAVGIIGIFNLPNINLNIKKKITFISGILVLLCAGIASIPYMYGSYENEWNMFKNPLYEYEKFSNSSYDLELTGMYQYIFRDSYLTVLDDFKDYQAEYSNIDKYFDEMAKSDNNKMTGLLKNKNVIIFMMESIDDWIIDEHHTPTIYKMINEGIYFENLYTPAYSTGYTFNTEFSFNTSVYPFSNGDVTYSLSKNDFSKSIASVFKDNGYNVNSYHEGKSTFYNRGIMHKAFGYDTYNSYQNYSSHFIEVQDDSFLYTNDELYNDLISDDLFMSFVITYSAHLPYTTDDELFKKAIEKYPEYGEGEVSELDVLRAKARLTDDMFKGLLERLEENGILDDTVIIGFGDHYAYGLTDKEQLQELSESAGNSILENTPAFIYSADKEFSMTVNKVMQITDFAPTIENLFGLEVPSNVMGRDIFDDEYDGYAIFPNNTWITNEAYMKNGELIYNEGMTAEELMSMQEFVLETYEINDSILKSNYYQKNDD